MGKASNRFHSRYHFAFYYDQIDINAFCFGKRHTGRGPLYPIMGFGKIGNRVLHRWATNLMNSTMCSGRKRLLMSWNSNDFVGSFMLVLLDWHLGHVLRKCSSSSIIGSTHGRLRKSSIMDFSLQNSQILWCRLPVLLPYLPVSTFSLCPLIRILDTKLLPVLDGRVRYCSASKAL